MLRLLSCELLNHSLVLPLQLLQFAELITSFGPLLVSLLQIALHFSQLLISGLQLKKQCANCITEPFVNNFGLRLKTAGQLFLSKFGSLLFLCKRLAFSIQRLDLHRQFLVELGQLDDFSLQSRNLSCCSASEVELFLLGFVQALVFFSHFLLEVADDFLEGFTVD